MALYSDLPIYKTSYDLLLAIFMFTKDFARDYKYTIGEELKRQTLEVFILIYRANSQVQKQQVIQDAREHLEVVRLLVRVLKDLHQVSIKKFAHLNVHIEAVSKQLTGWKHASKA